MSASAWRPAPRVARPERAAAGQHAADDGLVGVVAARQPAHLAEGHDGARRARVEHAAARHRVAQAVEAALQEPHERPARPGRRARPQDGDREAPGARRGQGRRGAMQRADAQAPRPGGADDGAERAVGGHGHAPRADAAPGRDAQDDVLPGDGGRQHAGHAERAAPEHDGGPPHAVDAREPRRQPGRGRLGRGRRGGGRRRRRGRGRGRRSGLPGGRGGRTDRTEGQPGGHDRDRRRAAAAQAGTGAGRDRRRAAATQAGTGSARSRRAASRPTPTAAATLPSTTSAKAHHSKSRVAENEIPLFSACSAMHGSRERVR